MSHSREEIKRWMWEHAEECSINQEGVKHVDASELADYAAHELGVWDANYAIPEHVTGLAEEVASEYQQVGAWVRGE